MVKFSWKMKVTVDSINNMTLILATAHLDLKLDVPIVHNNVAASVTECKASCCRSVCDTNSVLFCGILIDKFCSIMKKDMSYLVI